MMKNMKDDEGRLRTMKDKIGQGMTTKDNDHSMITAGRESNDSRGHDVG